MRKLGFFVLAMCLIFAFSSCSLVDAFWEGFEEGWHGSAASSTPAPATELTVAPTPENTLTAAQIFEYNADAVFTIYVSADNNDFHSAGSGFFVDSTGVAVTNHHVITGWPYAIIRTHSGWEFDISGYYSYDLENDLAIIQVEGHDPSWRSFPFLSVGDSSALSIGDNIYAIGSPLGYHNTFSTGIVSRFSDVSEFGIYRVYGMIQITAPISGGSSGGALLNSYGHVVGVTAAGYFDTAAQSINFAIPIARVDLSATTSGVHALPLGDAHYISEENLVGTWLWSGGDYVFHADGSGDRIWDGVFDEFEWEIAHGMVLVLSFEDDNEERWVIYVVSEDEVSIGGALFTRYEAPELDEIGRTLVGEWTWEQGWYIFYEDGSGTRDWSGHLNTFRWHMEGSTVVFYPANEDTERWHVNVINQNELTIGGAPFRRQ
ncbi:MAG: S1C family serine protease [Defluviitaleaceae bacterium]|nr:S1C family serine protease [Defluviitaleaceae bacterium]